MTGFMEIQECDQLFLYKPIILPDFYKANYVLSSISACKKTFGAMAVASCL